MKYLSLLALGAAILLSGCETTALRPKYDPIGYKPKDPSKVIVKVSLDNRMVYVLENGKPLLVTATAIGTPTKPTPKGSFRVFNKIQKKRSGSYGFWVKGDTIIPGESSKAPGSGYSYVGFPMQYWVEFAPGYGFHEGSVWPIPRTHGCLRLHKNAAREFFELTSIGTPIYIANTQPEDQTIGKNQPRPLDYDDPDPAKSFTISGRVFTVDETQYLRAQP